MGQNGEEAAELVATIRGEHVVMKNWFMGNSKEAAELRSKYGPYPGLWKEVLNWPGWKEARKVYLQVSQTPSNGNSSVSDSSAVPRKRRSRWGDATTDSNKDCKRRSRWDRLGSNAGSNPNAGSSVPQPVPPPPALPGLALPGMPTNLSPEQQDEMKRHQGRLRAINDKLANLETEASRVDALPRDHPDRSPSPPPGKWAYRVIS